MNNDFEQWFADKYPDESAIIEVYNTGSPAAGYLDAMIPLRHKVWCEATWNAATAKMEERVKELKARVKELEEEVEHQGAVARTAIHFMKEAQND